MLNSIKKSAVTKIGAKIILSRTFKHNFMRSFNTFTHIFKNQIDKLLQSNLFYGRKNKNVLWPTEWTFLINIAVYKTVVSYNTKYQNNKLMMQPETSGRFPSDFTIFSPNGKKIIVIEHENSLMFNKIKHNYIKLVEINDCEYRLLICYINTKNTPKGLIEKLQKVKSKNKYKKPVNVLVAYKCDSKLFQSSKSFLHDVV